MFKFAIPLLHVSNTDEAEKFYCGLLGFQRRPKHSPFHG